MALGLGNNLIRNGGASNPDKLSLDLQFAADKTLVARKGPTPVFTRASTATFVGSNGLIQSAGNNVARFDHDTVTPFACKGLLIEESRTNLVLQSENHPSASWTKTGVTVASASNTAPDGVATSNLASEDLTVGLHRIFQSTAYVSGTSYSISVFLKYAGRQFVAITNPGVAVNGTAIFDIQNGTISLTQSGVTTSITAYPNGWYRCVVNGVSAITGGASHIIQGSTTGGSLTGSYLGLNGPAFYIYGSQVEAGTFPTSYIPTTTGPLTRSADVCSITSSTLWNTSEGALFTHSILPVGGYDCYPANWVNYFGHRRSATNSLLGMIRGGGTFDITLAASGIAAATLKIASSYGGGSQSAVYNNNTVVSQATAFTLSPTVLNLGANSPTTCINGHLTSVKYYRKKLSDAKLQQLTT